MLDLFSIAHFGRCKAWRLFLVLLAVAGLNACENSSAPATTRNGAEPPSSNAVPVPATPVTREDAAAKAAESAAAAPAAEATMPPPQPSPAPGAGASGGAGTPSEAGAIGHGKKAKKAARPSAGDVVLQIPLFDWPPPKASAEQSIPGKWLRTGPATKLADVADKFEKALRLAHYGQWSYYGVPHGFALATQLEQIQSDGTPMPGADRWKIGTPSVANLSLLTFIEALAHAPAGRYRAIVFVVTDVPWVQSTTAASDEQIKGWAGGGTLTLPASIGALPYDQGYRTQALIYEFQKGTSGPAQTVLPSTVSGETHLDKGGIWEPLSIL